MNLRIASYNCRSIKNSSNAVRELCENHDICLLQEHWLTKDNINFLAGIHQDFDYYGESAVDTSEKLLIGRPYGGIGFLWRKSIGHAVKIRSFQDSRILGIELVSNNNSKMLILCVYMPTCCSENHDEFIECLAKVHSIVQSSDCYSHMIIGDWNADNNSLFGTSLQSFCNEYNYLISDKMLLNGNSFTYFSEVHGTTSWLDHCISTHSAHQCIKSMSVLYDTISSDHFPLSIMCDIGILPPCDCTLDSDGNYKQGVNWSKVNNNQRNNYTAISDRLLSDICIPTEALCCKNTNCSNVEHAQSISKFYDDIIDGLHIAGTKISSGTSRNNSSCTVAGWNDHLKELHSIARDAFQLWRECGKPRHGPLFDFKRRTHSRFKYALRVCRRNEDQNKADAAAKSLYSGNCKQFWSSVNKINTKTPPRPNNINGCSGDANIAEMWRKHYSDLFNVVHTKSDQKFVLNSIENCKSDNVTFISPSDVQSSIDKLQAGKSAGPDSLSAEHFMYASKKISVLLSMCFNAMLTHVVCPRRLTEVMLVPIIKDKNSNIGDKNNYRPIALSTICSKILEFVILNYIESFLDTSDYQFGFKSCHSTDMCVFVLKEVINFYRKRGSNVIITFLDASKAFDRVNHWTLFKKLISRNVPTYFVRYLVAWYRTQCIFIRWGNVLSQSFNVTNGVKQGGVLSPKLFNVYVDHLSSRLVNSNVGCSIGGLFSCMQMISV